MKRKVHHPVFGDIEIPKNLPDSPKIRSARRDSKKRQAALINAYKGIDLPGLMQALCMGQIRGPEALALARGTVTQRKKVLREIQLRTGVGACRWSPPEPLDPAQEVTPPMHVVRPKNGPTFSSWLVDPNPPGFPPDEEPIQFVSRQAAAGMPPDELIVMLVANTGKSWERTREFVRDVLQRPDVVSDELLELLKQAWTFWRGIAFFRGTYLNACNARFIREARGYWLMVPDENLPLFLAGLKVPQMHKRVEYLIWVDRASKWRLLLDFYSVDYVPLFRVEV